MGKGSNRSRTGKPATLCELRTRMRDLDQSSRITIPASGFCKCRIKRPDRRAHSIPKLGQEVFFLLQRRQPQKRDYGFAPEPPCGRSGLTAKRYGLCAPPAAPNEVSLTPEAGRPGCAKPGAAQTKTDPCRSQSVGPWPGASHGLGTATEAECKSAGGPMRGTSHPQERGQKVARDRVRQSRRGRSISLDRRWPSARR